MPTIAFFYGMVVRMFWHDHPPPHFHVTYKGRKVVVMIETGEIARGALPPGAAGILRSWTTRHREELLAN